jgi:hypothetical protein
MFSTVYTRASQINPIHTTPLFPSKIDFNINPHTYVYVFLLVSFFSLDFHTQIPYSPRSHAYYMLYSSHPPYHSIYFSEEYTL